MYQSVAANKARALVSDEIVDRLNTPIEQARGLPNGAYTSDEFFALERESLFPHTWVFASPASDVPNPGDTKPVEVAGRSLIVARGNDGEIRVFYNVCPHRGARLLTESAAGLRTISCPYHAWSFDLTGTLRVRPHYHGPDNHDRGDNDQERPCLFGVRSHTWFDWVFVNIDGVAPDFDSYMAPFTQHFDGFDLSAFQPAFCKRFEFEANWKLIIENYCDFYHIFKVHPGLHQKMTKNQRGAMKTGGAHLFNGYTFEGGVQNLADDDVGLSVPVLPMIEGLADGLKQGMVYGNMFPNTAINVYPTNLQFVSFEPLSADRSAMTMWFYFVANGATDEVYKEARETMYAWWNNLNAEDEDVCQRLQQGRDCDAYDGGRLAPFWDTGTLHFHRQIADAINQQGHFVLA